MCHNVILYIFIHRNSLVVQWLGLCISTLGAPGSIPGWGTKIPQDTWHSQKKKKKKIYIHLLICRQCHENMSSMGTETCKEQAGDSHNFFVMRDFPGGTVVKTLHFQCMGHVFDPWSGT